MVIYGDSGVAIYVHFIHIFRSIHEQLRKMQLYRPSGRNRSCRTLINRNFLYIGPILTVVAFFGCSWLGLNKCIQFPFEIFTLQF